MSEDEPIECEECNGAGYLIKPPDDAYECYVCNGDGYV